MVLAGTGKEGKTKEVVKDREGKMVCMYVCLCVSMYVLRYPLSRAEELTAAKEQCACTNNNKAWHFYSCDKTPTKWSLL